MSQFCVPYLIVCYGSEMLFILEQRLAAQNVKPEKSAKVLQDICRAVFAPTFVQELVRPQLIYSHSATREIFDKLAHSSSMRLSENSMDKLFDLMTMACKYQLYACRTPRDVARATLLHLDAVRSSVQATEATTTAIDSTLAAVRDLSATLTDGQLADVRHSLLNFFVGKRVKISLLMQEKLQHRDGSFVREPCPIPAAEQSCPVLPIGTVQYFDATGTSVASTAQVAHPDLGLESKAVPDNRLGRNLYTIERKKDGDAAAVSAKTSATPVNPSSRAAPAGKGAYAASSNSSTAISALNTFIVGNASKDAGAVTIQNLFDDGGAGSGVPAAAASSSGAGDVITIAPVSREEMQRANPDLMTVVNSFSHDAAPAAASPAKPSAEQDLLDLMDGM